MATVSDQLKVLILMLMVVPFVYVAHPFFKTKRNVSDFTPEDIAYLSKRIFPLFLVILLFGIALTSVP